MFSLTLFEPEEPLEDRSQNYGLSTTGADSWAAPGPFLLQSPWGGAQESAFSQVSWLIRLCTRV